MNALIDTLLNEYPKLNEPSVRLANNELEEAFVGSKLAISTFLQTKNVAWVLERASFADEVERAIMLNTAAIISSAIVRKTPLREKTYQDMCSNLCTELDNLKSKILLEAEQSPEKPLVKKAL